MTELKFFLTSRIYFDALANIRSIGSMVGDAVDGVKVGDSVGADVGRILGLEVGS